MYGCIGFGVAKQRECVDVSMSKKHCKKGRTVPFIIAVVAIVMSVYKYSMVMS